MILGRRLLQTSSTVCEAAQARIGHRQQPIAILAISIIKDPHNLDILGQIEAIGGLGITLSRNVNVVSDIYRSPSPDAFFNVRGLWRVKIKQIRPCELKANFRASVVLKSCAYLPAT
jgi:hypothetical protein